MAGSQSEHVFGFLLFFFGFKTIKVINVTVNGEKKELPEGCTILVLLKQLGLESLALAVEVNQQLKPRNLHSTTVIAQDDVLEIVTLVGGG